MMRVAGVAVVVMMVWVRELVLAVGVDVGVVDVVDVGVGVMLV